MSKSRVSDLVVAGSVFDRSVAYRLAMCPHFRRVSSGGNRLWNSCKCLMDGSRCGSRGKRLRFKQSLGDDLHVTWVCPLSPPFSAEGI